MTSPFTAANPYMNFPNPSSSNNHNTHQPYEDETTKRSRGTLEWEGWTLREKIQFSLPHEKNLIEDRWPPLDIPFDIEERKKKACKATLQAVVQHAEQLYPRRRQQQQQPSIQTGGSRNHNYDDNEEDDSDNESESSGEGYEIVTESTRRAREAAAAAAASSSSAAVGSQINPMAITYISGKQAFIDALPNCEAMTLGFFVLPIFPHMDECCYCPCGRPMQRWRERFGLGNPPPNSLDDCSNSSGTASGGRRKGSSGSGRKKFQPDGLIQHLQQKASGSIEGGGILHWIALQYLQALFKDYVKTDNPVNTMYYYHKAFYKRGDVNWCAVEAIQQRKQHHRLEKLQKDLDQERAKAQKAHAENEILRRLERVNRDLHKQITEHKKEMERLESLLGVKEVQSQHLHQAEQQMTPERLSDYRNEYKETIAEYADLYKSWRHKIDSVGGNGTDGHANTYGKEESDDEFEFDTDSSSGNNHATTTTRTRNNNNNNKYATTKQPAVPIQRIVIQVPHGFILSDMLLKWSNRRDSSQRLSNPNTYLFEELRNTKKSSTRGIFWAPWEIIFTSTAQKGIEKAIDDGGPTREFVSEVWRQLDAVSVGNATLFERDANNGYCKLKTDIQLRSNLEDIKVARLYYRAIGRIMAYCVIHEIPMDDHVFVRVIKNYLFRGMSPLNDAYRIEDLLFDVMGKNAEIADVLQAFGEDITEKTIPEIRHAFRQLVYDNYIEESKIALSSLKEGLYLCYTATKVIAKKQSLCTLKSYNPSAIFGHMPYSAMHNILFASPQFTAQDVIDILTIVHPGDSQDRPDKYMYIPQQEATFDMLKNILIQQENTNPDYLVDFVHFCTGYRCLPFANFNINVEFTFDRTEEKYFEEHEMDQAYEYSSESLPVAHTCDHTLKLPGTGYTSMDIFKSKLDASLATAKVSGFDRA